MDAPQALVAEDSNEDLRHYYDSVCPQVLETLEQAGEEELVEGFQVQLGDGEGGK